jgi:hypothetical protein
LDAGNLYFYDWSRGGSVGSVNPDFYITDKSQQQGIVGDATTEIYGFANGGLAGATFYGTADVYANDQDNILFFNPTAGALTGILLASGERITFTGLDSSGRIFGYSDMNNVYNTAGTATVGYADNALFLEHILGSIQLAGGGYVVNDSAKVAQISVTI